MPALQHKLPFTLLLAASLGLGACAGPGSKPKPSTPAVKQMAIAKAETPTALQRRLQSHYRSWKKTPHKLGGLSRQGIDCSGFVHVTYRDVFTTRVPRSTETLAKAGKPVKRRNLKTGDLVFFKTGRKQRHVGIYVGNGQFIHASSSRGVMQSSLDNVYWREHYWQAKRLLN
jgi:cell wall-associated NlpC family hydrolase